MTPARATLPHVAIACGGTGGHLFPGLAVARQILARGGSVTLLISPKEVDQQAVKSARGLEIVTLPAVALQRGRRFAFLAGCWQSWCAARQLFKSRRPDAVLAMGGFTSAPPVLAGRGLGVKTFLHESNTIPGRANRWLARLVDQAFVGFSQTGSRLAARQVTCTGTPVRPQFQPRDAALCRVALGLDGNRPMVLVMGGSQGADKINNALINGIENLSNIDGMHIILSTGRNNYASVTEKVIKIMDNLSMYGLVEVVPFIEDMRTALQDADLIVSRAGATTIAEIKCAGKPAILIPYPYATGDHQTFNAKSAITQGFAYMISNSEINDKLVPVIKELLSDGDLLDRMGKKALECNSNNASAVLSELITKCANQYN